MNESYHPAPDCSEPPVSKRRTLGLWKILLRQHVLFPAALILPNIVLFLFFAVANMMGRFEVNPVEIFAITGVMSAVAAVGLTVQYRRFDGKRPAHFYRALILSPLALNLTAAFIGFLFVKQEIHFAVMMGAINPVHFVMSLWIGIFYPALLPAALLLSQFVFCGVFLLFSFVRIRESGRKAVRRTLACVAASVFCLAAVLSGFMQYPEIEFFSLKQRFDEIPFNEEIDDYLFYEHTPFSGHGDFASLDEESTLKFDYITATPSIDGATAFYPLYCAFAESTYAAVADLVENEMLKDEYYRYSVGTHDDSTPQHPSNSKIYCTKTGTAFKRLADRKTDIVFAFEPSLEQLAYAEEQGVSFKLTKIGYDAFCFFVSAQNPVDSLKLEDIRSIYAGKINNWKYVGGPNKRIFAFQRPSGSGSQTAMENTVMKDLKISTRYQAQTVRTMGGMIRVIDSYLNTPAAIGYTFMYYSSNMVTGSQIKYIAVDGIAPDAETVSSNAYPFTCPFYAITREGEETAETAAFVDWILGPQGKSLIEKTGYVPA